MLPDAYRWIENPEGAWLHFNAMCVATVLPRDGKWRVAITFQQRGYSGACASREQGQRYVERWLGARKGIPGLGKRRR